MTIKTILKKKRRNKVVSIKHLFFFIIVLIVISTFGISNANSSDKNKSLPEIIKKYCQNGIEGYLPVKNFPLKNFKSDKISKIRCHTDRSVAIYDNDQNSSYIFESPLGEDFTLADPIYASKYFNTDLKPIIYSSDTTLYPLVEQNENGFPILGFNTHFIIVAIKKIEFKNGSIGYLKTERIVRQPEDKDLIDFLLPYTILHKNNDISKIYTNREGWNLEEVREVELGKIPPDRLINVFFSDINNLAQPEQTAIHSIDNAFDTF